MLKLLKLINFRNHKNRTIEFHKNCTILLADNGSGKTNILEAISLLAIQKSFRSVTEYEYIDFNIENNYHEEDFAKIESQVSDDKLELLLNKNKRTNRIRKVLKVNDVLRKKNQRYPLKVIVFSPEDLRLLTGSPTRRREYLDFIISQVDVEYKNALSAYAKNIKQRNKLLSSIDYQQYLSQKDHYDSSLLFWDNQVVSNAEIIQAKRSAFIDYINNNIKEYSRIYKGYDLKIVYKQAPITHDLLRRNRDKEIVMGVTKFGPQKDDFEMTLFKNGHWLNAKTTISRGEQRIAILILKYIERDFILSRTGIKPLILLDDIFSELDNNYRTELVKFLEGYQSVITSADENNLPDVLLCESKVIGI